MSENQQLALLIGVQKELRSIQTILKNVVETATLKVVNEIKFLGNVLAKLWTTGRKVSGVGKGLFEKDLGVKSSGKTGMSDLFDALNRIFEPLKASLSPVRQTPDMIKGAFGQSVGVGQAISPERMQALQEAGNTFQPSPFQNMGKIFKKLGKGISGTFKGVGSSLAASFSPMMLIFQVLSPMIQAFLEPLDLLSPLLESWGTMLSQLLIPIIMALMDILMPFTPLIMLLVDVLMPILDFIPAFVSILVPALEFVISIIMIAVNVIGVFIAVIMGIINTVTYAIGGISGAIFGFFTILFTKINDLVTSIRDFFTGIFSGALAWIKNSINTVKNIFTDFWDSLFGGITDKFKAFADGGLDGNADTWW